MTYQFRNSGIINQGTMNISGTAIGDGAMVVQHGSPQDRGNRRVELGVITVKSLEARAVVDILRLRRERIETTDFYCGTVADQGEQGRVAMIQNMEQGQRSTIPAFEWLKEVFRPAVVALVGIGGGFHPDIPMGDVAIATRAVYYDLRKETKHGIQRRGQERETSAAVIRAVNSFFVEHGEPARFRGDHAEFQASPCIIGTGDAVIKDAESEIRKYLKQYNDKISVVDMEAGGLTQAFHERRNPAEMVGWVVVRGVSDHADENKNDALQVTAARHAAQVLRALIPYLPYRT